MREDEEDWGYYSTLEEETQVDILDLIRSGDIRMSNSEYRSLINQD